MRSVICLALFAACLCPTATTFAREWTDDTGAFSVEAELVEVRDDAVRLKKQDGTIVKVPLERLSKKDINYLKSVNSKPADKKMTAAEKIEAALHKVTPVDFVDVPLEDVVQYLQDLHNIPIMFDRRPMDDIGVGVDTPVRATLRDMKLADVLDKLLEPIDLTWVVYYDVLFITSKDEAETLLETRVYNVTKRVELDKLVEDLTTNIEPDTWEEVGGSGAVVALSTARLIVSQTQQTHRKIRQHYNQLLQAVPGDASDMVAVPGAEIPMDVLSKPANCQFLDTPLKDVVAFLQDVHKVKIHIDSKALDDVGLGSDTPVTFNLRTARLSSALTLMLRDMELVWTADKTGITITTPDADEYRITLAAYPERDLAAVAKPDELIEAVKSTVAPDSWTDVGGDGQIRSGIRGTIDVRQSFWGHQQVATLFHDLLKSAKMMRD